LHHSINKFLLFIFGMCCLLIVASCDKPRPPLKVSPGQQLPAIVVQDLKGNSDNLSLASGKILVLNVWATWCGPCRYELPSLDRLAKILDSKKFSVVGLSVDDDNYVVREFLIDRKIQFKNYLDVSRQVTSQVFGVRAFPSTLLIAADGRLLEVIEGWRNWDTPAMISKIKALSTAEPVRKEIR